MRVSKGTDGRGKMCHDHGNVKREWRTAFLGRLKLLRMARASINTEHISHTWITSASMSTSGMSKVGCMELILSFPRCSLLF